MSTNISLLQLLLYIVVVSANQVYRDPLNDAMYQYYAYSPCRTFFNATGPVGCHTKKGGVVAPLYHAEDIASLFKLRDIKSKQIIVTPSQFLSNEFAHEVVSYSPVAWIITHSKTTPTSAFSAATPTEWNPNASGLRWQNLPFPMVFIANETSSNQLIQKAAWNQEQGAHDSSSAQVAKLDPYVGPNDMTIRKCYDLKRCKRMGGYSMWGTLGAADERAKIFAVTQLDAISMNMGHAVGANAGASGMIALLAAAATFNRSTTASKYKRQISYGFFDGESFGRMGSRRFVRDLAQWSCENSTMGPHGYKICTGTVGQKLKTAVAPDWYWVPESFGRLNRTEFVLAVDHVGQRANGQDGMFLHGKGISESLASANFGVNGMKLTSSSTTARRSSPLPPSPADSFIEGTFGMDIEHGKDVHVLSPPPTAGSDVLNAAVLTGYKDTIEEVNKFFQTSHDDLHQLNVNDLTRTATTIARTLYALATVENLHDAAAVQSSVSSPIASQLFADPLLIERLVNCSVVSWDCSLTEIYLPRFIEIARGKIKNANINLSPDRRLQYLWRQNGKYVASPQVTILRELLADVTAVPGEVSPTDCSGDQYQKCRMNITGQECVRGQCIEPNAWFHWARDVDDKSAWSASGTYINYKITVPGSRTPAVEVYRSASVGNDIGMLFVGGIISIASIYGTKWLIRKNDMFQLITKNSL